MVKFNKIKRCVSCKKDAQVDILYPFCEDCFIKHYLRRVEKIIKKFKLVEENDNILVCVSGGKDSLSCADVLNQYRNTYSFQIGILHIDVGLYECTNERTLQVVERFAQERNIPFYLVRFTEYFNIDIENLFKKSRRPRCSICGMLKRYVMNRFARENGFNKIATGHCADDIIRFFFKNWTNYSFEWIDKLKPKTERDCLKQITRVRPLFEMLEKENFWYTKIKNIVVAGCSQCSFFMRKDKWYDILRIIDEKDRYFKLQFLRGLYQVDFSFKKEEREFKECKICGEITDKDICAVCKLVKR